MELLLLFALPLASGLNIEAGFVCTSSSNEYACSFALDRNLSSAWASAGPAPQWLEARIADGTYATLGSYALSAILGRADLAPTAWRLEGIEPNSPSRQLLDQVSGVTWSEGSTQVRELAGLSSWRSYQLTLLEGTGTQVGIAELQLLPKLDYAYDVSDWEPCSVTCGGGTQTRTVDCKGSDGVSYSDIRCSTDPAPARSRACGTSICACQGGLACSALCSSSSANNADLTCGVLVDGSSLSAWTSAGPPLQWLEWDLGQARQVVEFSITAGECTACTTQEGPAMVSLQATNAATSAQRSWLEIRPEFSVGPVWASGETRRFSLPEGGTFNFQYWRLNFHQTFGGAAYQVHVSEVGLYAPATSYRLAVGAWGACGAVGGSGSCGAGLVRREVHCFDVEDYVVNLENCEEGTSTSTEQSCVLDCPQLVVASAVAHANFFGILRVQLTAQWRAKVLCAAYEVPMADNSPSASAVDNALYTGIGFADGSNGTCDVEGILVSRFAGEEFEVRCKVVGGDQVFGQGRRAVLRPVPLLMGCYADFDNDRDLPEDQGVQTQVSCADSCFGSEYFGLQLRGRCHCGDSYGRHGVKSPNYTAGLTGCDCNGPYYAYQANCVWQQTGGRFGDETMLPLRLSSVTADSAEMLADVERDARLRCNVTAADISKAPSTSATCTASGCKLAMGNLEPSTTYTVHCEAEADVLHRAKRLMTLLVRTLDPEVPPVTMTPTRAPVDLSEPDYVLSTSEGPLERLPHGLMPSWIWAPALVFAFAGVCLTSKIFGQGKNSLVLESLELPHTFWLIWELLVAADLSLGTGFLLILLLQRFEREAPYWDDLSSLQACALMSVAALHVAGFLSFGLLPAFARCMAYQVSKQRAGNNWTLHRYKNLQHRTGASKRKRFVGSSQLPPELDEEQNASPLHYLPFVSLWAICKASEQDIELMVPYKVGLNLCHLFGSLFQAFCCAFYMSHDWPIAASLGVGIACICMTLFMGICLALALMRALQVSQEVLVQQASLRSAANAARVNAGASGAEAKLPAPPRVGLKGGPKGAAVGKPRRT